MLTSEYLRRQAALCLRMAAAIDDPSIVASLVVMADDFSVKADEIDPILVSSRQAAVPRVAIEACELGNKRAAG
jgi:hypothetical protein